MAAGTAESFSVGSLRSAFDTGAMAFKAVFAISCICDAVRNHGGSIFGLPGILVVVFRLIGRDDCREGQRSNQ